MLVGASGTGKSRLLVEALHHGAHLIADDRVRLCALNGHLVASAVPELVGVVEVRGMGLIRQPDVAQSHPIHLVAELDPTTQTRLPEPKTREFQGIQVPFLQLLPPPMTSIASLLLYLKAMQEHRILPPDWRPVG